MHAISIASTLSVIPQDLISAYEETIYQVDEFGDSFDLHIDVVNISLVELHAKHDASYSAFITAYNPYSQESSDEENEQLLAELAIELVLKNLTFFIGTGKHPSGKWKGEKSFLILGLDRAAAISLGNSYRQNAIVWCGIDATPKLVLLK